MSKAGDIWFQSTRPHGARLTILFTPIFPRQFQSTRPHGARQNVNLKRIAVLGFNPRARTGRDEYSYSILLCKKFQSTRPHGARLTILFTPIFPRQFQSTRPHGARRNEPTPTPTPEPVSIHAPARGATPFRREYLLIVRVSIHAPARGATLLICRLTRRAKFQSTRPHGARHMHASYICLILRFNPRARTGRDLCLSASHRCLPRFQSTRPHGARPSQ